MIIAHFYLFISYNIKSPFSLQIKIYCSNICRWIHSFSNFCKIKFIDAWGEERGWREDCVQPYSSAYNTRRSEPAQHMLNVPYYDYKQHKSFTHLSNSFFYSAPRLWNSLPDTCRCAPSLSAFRSRLKAYLWTN